MVPPSIALYAQRNLGINGQTKARRLPTLLACLLLHPLPVPSTHLAFELQHRLLLWLKMLYLFEIIFHLLSLTLSGKDDVIFYGRTRMQPPTSQHSLWP